MTRESSNVGEFLRAARLGFYWSERHTAYIRMTELQNNEEGIRIQIEVYPPGFLQKTDLRVGKGTEKEVGRVLVWKDTPAILYKIKTLANRRDFFNPTVFIVDENGQEIKKQS